MSERSTISELARFIGGSALTTEDAGTHRRTIDGIATRLKPAANQRRVSELLGAVMALSSRARRSALPAVAIELDVFSPDGGRAMRLMLPDRG